MQERFTGNRTRFDAPDFLEVYENTSGDFCDRWTVYIGNACYTMSDNATAANGVCMYGGPTCDCLRPMMEDRRVVGLSDLPTQVRQVVVRLLLDAERPVPGGLLVAPFDGPLADVLRAMYGARLAASEALS